MPILDLYKDNRIYLLVVILLVMVLTCLVGYEYKRHQ